MGSFNWREAHKEAAADLNNRNLGLIVLGQSGSGKSSLAGTFGKKTLYLYTTGESHGAAAAAAMGGDILPVCINYSGSNLLEPDAAYDRLISILSDVDGIKKEGFGAIAVDGATEIEALIRSTTRWRTMCLTAQGKHNNFAEGAATLAMFRPIVDQLKTLQRSIGIDFVVTCALDVTATSDDGEIFESKPRLLTYAVAEGLIQQFADIVVVGRMSKNDQIQHRLQFLAGVSRESKDAQGVVRKSINFNPRISGIKLDDLPKTLPADLSKLVALKRNNGKAKNDAVSA